MRCLNLAAVLGFCFANAWAAIAPPKADHTLSCIGAKNHESAQHFTIREENWDDLKHDFSRRSVQITGGKHFQVSQALSDGYTLEDGSKIHMVAVTDPELKEVVSLKFAWLQGGDRYSGICHQPVL